MKFSDLENVPIYTKLKTDMGEKKDIVTVFCGFTHGKTYILTTSLEERGPQSWAEEEIKDWTIVKEPKKIYQHFCKVRHGANVETAINERNWAKYVGAGGGIRSFWEQIGTKEITFE